MSASRAIQFIQSSIQDIQTIFTQPPHPQKLADFIGSFSQHYEMITVTGARIDRKQLETMFVSKQGADPDLVIEVDEISVIMQTDRSVLLRYQETHHWPDHCHRRISTACIELQQEQCVWRYLHETTIDAIQ